MKEEALELADKLDEYNKDGLPVLVVGQAVEILRQQAKRIEELEKVNQEPVAWMNPSQVLHGVIDARTYWLNGFIPLYTHPHKELSDDEIAKIAMYSSDMNEYGHSKLDEFAFARAIIKASRGEE